MKCEACNKGEAMSLSYFGDRNKFALHGKCKLCCMCTSSTEDYYIEFDRYLNEGPEVWLQHLLGKTWFNRDDFINAVARADLLPVVAKIQ